MIETTSQLIALVESDNNPGAIRYEPGWRYVTNDLIAICRRSHAPIFMNDATARALMMFSYGRYQIMGSVLYEIGYRGTLLDFQNSVTLQDAWFTEFIRKRNIDFDLKTLANDGFKRRLFGARYNGAGEAYAAKMLSRMRLEGVL